jgi:tetratricopeptide (TPR) repeat protein
MAALYSRLGESRWWPVDKALRLQKEATQKALALDPSLGDAHLLSAKRLLLEFNLPAAEREFQRAIALNSNVAHSTYAIYLAQSGRKDEALAEAQRALEVDPLNRNTQSSVGWVYWLVGMPDRALAEANRADGSYARCFYCLVIMAQRGQTAEPIARWEKALDEDNAGAVGHLALAYIKAGRVADARRLLKKLENRARQEKMGAYEAAFVHATLGETDEAFRWLDTAFEQRDPGLLYLKTDHGVDSLRSDPRFALMLRRVGLPL